MTLSPGTKLGPYEVIAPLGAGGMGEVFRARDPRLGRDVAIKALPAVFAQDAERLARFEREAKLLASLNHPNVAGIHELEQVEGHRYLVLEFVEGETLAQRLGRGPLALDEALDVCRQIAAAVEAAHESGIVHRDLKPGNVMLKPDGTVKVLDFGLARSGVAATSSSDPHLSASPTVTHAVTQVNVVLGTAAYMSPEQARGRAVDRRTDIWSFGCVLYECLTGRQAFAGETVSDMIARILQAEPDWSMFQRSTPPRLRALLGRCLTKDAKERLQAIGEARIELAAIAQGGPAGEAAPPGAAAARRGGLPVWAAVGVVVVTALATLAAARLVARGTEPRTLRLSVLAPEGVTVSGEVPDITLSPDGGSIVFVGRDTSGVSHLWLRPLSSIGARLLPGTEDAKLPFWSPDGREIGFFAAGSLKRVAVDGEGVQSLTAAPNPRGAAWSPRGVIVFAPTASGPLMQVPASGGDSRPVTMLDTSRGEDAHRFPCFLPDGRHFLYVALPGKDTQLETRVGSLDGGPSPVVVTSWSGAVYAAPGYLIYNRQGSVVAQAFDTRTLRVKGPARPIRDLEDATGSYSGSPLVMASGNGVLLQREAERIDTRIDIFDRSGRVTSTLPLPSASYDTPRVSPDGTRLVMTRLKRGETTAPLWMVDLTRGTSARFTIDGIFDNAPAWTPDGRRVIYGSDRTGGRELYWKNADGSGAEALLADVPNLFNDPGDLSLDGRALAYRSLSGTTGEDIWMLPLDGQRKPRPLIVTRFNELDPALSPDGKWLAYRSDESGRFEIHAQSFPTLGRQLRVSTAGASPTTNNSLSRVRWRRDGRELFFIGGDGQTLMSVAVEPGDDIRFGIPRPLLKLPQGTFGVEVSGDGQRVFACVPAGARGRTVLNLLMNWERELRAAK